MSEQALQCIKIWCFKLLYRFNLQYFSSALILDYKDATDLIIITLRAQCESSLYFTYSLVAASFGKSIH